MDHRQNVGNVDGAERIVSLTVLQSESTEGLELAAVLLLELTENSCIGIGSREKIALN
jgi:hypothetical protein